MTPRSDLLAAYLETLEAVRADRLIEGRVRLDRDLLWIDDLPFPVDEPTYLAGAGKAACAMGRALRPLLGERFAGGLLVTKTGSAEPVDGVEVLESDHPVPSAASLAAGRRMREFLEARRAGERVVFVLSGGASSLLEDPFEGVSLDDLRRTTELLLGCGAPIEHVNAVRTALSRIKGGGLARAASPARTAVVVLSDVLGNDLAAIGSGPFDQGRSRNPLDIVRRYGIDRDLPPAVLVRLRAYRETERAAPVPHRIVGDNAVAIATLSARLSERGYRVKPGPTMTGEARDFAIPLPGPGEAIVGGGECTVTLRGDGLGGRAQELALTRSVDLRGTDAVLLVGSTDGADGPTDVAAAIVDGRPLDGVAEALARSDSHPALASAGALVRTGPTGTNLNDVYAIARPR